MKTVEVFDPAMCCSTGVCGPSVDPVLPRFAADLEWLGSQGVAVTRYNLAQQPEAFAGRPAVTAALQSGDDGVLPLVLVDGEPVSQGCYPDRAELAGWAGAPITKAGFSTPAVDELVAIGAAVASNCEPCLDYHVGRARDLGVDDAVIRRAVRTARTVKETPARAILRHADELLADTSAAPVGNGGCCASPVDVALTPTGQQASGGCC